ncbi:MAG: TetR/AcrR family transcriptional regulator [Candidatus Acidiferrales bacterium]
MQHKRKSIDGRGTAQRILRAAEEHFAAQGMEGARTDRIAAAAHANKAMLYYYFGDKRRLHRAVLENLFRQLSAGVYAPRKGSRSARENLRSFVARYFDFLATHPNYPRLVQREAMERTKNFDWIVREYLRPFYNQLTQAIERGVASGELRHVNAHHTAFTIVGMITSYFAAAPILGEVAWRNLLAANAVEERKRAVLDFIDHGLMTTGAKSR